MTEQKKKVYYSIVPFCSMHVTRAPSIVEQVSFVAGMLETSDPEVIAHVDAICDKPGSGITSRKGPGNTAATDDAHEAGKVAQTKAVAAGLATA